MRIKLSMCHPEQSEGSHRSVLFRMREVYLGAIHK